MIGRSISGNHRQTVVVNRADSPRSGDPVRPPRAVLAQAGTGPQATLSGGVPDG